MINKVTKLYATNLGEEEIQAHLDEMNAQGFSLIAVDNMRYWYRFFWGKPS